MLLKVFEKFPDIKGVRWFNLLVLTITPAVAAYGFLFSPRRFETIVFSVIYYVFSMLGANPSTSFVFVD